MATIRSSLWKWQQPAQYIHRYMIAANSRLCSSNSSSNTTPSTEAGSTPTKKKVTGPPELKEKVWQIEFHQQEKGKIAGKLPFKLQLKKGKKYAWCACGHSKNQPLCDGTHNIAQLRIKMRPMVFKAPDDMEVWLCTCKQSNNRPFCDGSHKSEVVQEAKI